MYKIIKYSLFTGALVFFISGCATIASGTTQTITFDSGPQGANVYINDVFGWRNAHQCTCKAGRIKQL